MAKVSDVLQLDMEVDVVVIGKDERGNFKVSRKPLLPDRSNSEIHRIKGGKAVRQSQIDESHESIIEVGQVYKGRIVSIKDYGAFVELPTGEQSLLHISQVAHGRTEKIEDVFSIDMEVDVAIIGKDHRGKFVLSRKSLLPVV